MPSSTSHLAHPHQASWHCCSFTSSQQSPGKCLFRHCTTPARVFGNAAQENQPSPLGPGAGVGANPKLGQVLSCTPCAGLLGDCRSRAAGGSEKQQMTLQKSCPVSVTFSSAPAKTVLPGMSLAIIHQRAIQRRLKTSQSGGDTLLHHEPGLCSLHLVTL